ncbi:MAG TPA: c-type cytochrome [Longimicrobiaceae bacterium]
MTRLVRNVAIALAGLVGVLLLAALVLYFVGTAKLNRTYEVVTAELEVPSDPAATERGAHLARIHGCTDCHGPGFEGRVMVDAPPFRVVASNLTTGEGGVGDEYDARALDAAIRHGVGYDGRALSIMPAAGFHHLSDADAAALIAHIQQLPPVDNVLPETEYKPLGRVLAAFALDVDAEVRPGPARSTAPPAGPTAEYGAYLTSITCAYCHGPELEGADSPVPGSPPAPALAAAGRWSLADFERALRTGVTPDGRTLNPEYMPWTFTARMTDEEIAALHAYLATLSPAE